MKIFCVLLAWVGSALSIHLSLENPTTPGQYCIILDANITGTVKYWDNVINKTQTYDFVINDTNTTNTTGHCLGWTYKNHTPAESMSILFFPNNIRTMPDRWNLTLFFDNKKDQASSFQIFDYELTVFFYPEFFNVSYNSTTYTKAYRADGINQGTWYRWNSSRPVELMEWETVGMNAFSCSSSDLSFTNETTVQFKDMRVLAFAMLDHDTFPSNQNFEQCKLDVRTSYIVPIFVGACLAGLVVIMLINYLIKSARAKRQEYASV